MKFVYESIVFVGFALLFVGCGYDIPTPQKRFETASIIAKQNHLHQKIYKTRDFNIFSYSTDLSKCKQKNLHIYIEGDGLSWITSSTVSDDPTPINPTALKLMVQDSSTCKLYLARPCQYTSSSQCSSQIWTSDRFSQEVIDSYDEVLDDLKAQKITLFGYSGGGAIATLLAAQRADIDELITIAGNLDIEFWAKMHYITPLSGSLNPADFADKLESVKQIHLIGGDDEIVGMSVFDSYRNHFADESNIKFKVYKGFTHSCCWVKNWKETLKELGF
jgi:predicted esterase